MLGCGDSLRRAWISRSELTCSTLSNTCFMHLMATGLPVFSEVPFSTCNERASKTTAQFALLS